LSPILEKLLQNFFICVGLFFGLLNTIIAKKEDILFPCKYSVPLYLCFLPYVSGLRLHFRFIFNDLTLYRANKAKSVGAVVATAANSSMTCWYSSVVQHTSGEELSDYIAADIIKAVRHWAKVNNEELTGMMLVIPS